MVKRQAETLCSFNQHLLSTVQRGIRFLAYIRDHLGQPRHIFGRNSGGSHVSSAQGAASHRRTHATECGTQTFAELKRCLLALVAFLDNHRVAIHADAFPVKTKLIKLTLQDLEVNQSTGGNQQSGLRADVAGRQLPEKNCVTPLSYKGMARIWSATTNADVDFFLLRDEGGNLALTFAPILSTNNHPKAHDGSPRRILLNTASTPAYSSRNVPLFFNTANALSQSELMCCSTGCESARRKVSSSGYRSLSRRHRISSGLSTQRRRNVEGNAADKFSKSMGCRKPSTTQPPRDSRRLIRRSFSSCCMPPAITSHPTAWRWALLSEF